MSNNVNKSVFVSDLSSDTTEANLVNVFCSCGPILSVRICRDQSGQSLGYGFVNFGDALSASHAIDTKNFVELNGRQIRVMISETDPNERHRNKANVFVKNLDQTIDNKRLYETFKRFGRIMSCKVAEDVNGLSKGYGFVQFVSEESAIDAINAMNGRQWDGKTVFCSHFVNKTERKLISNNNKFFAKRFQNIFNIYVKNLSQNFDSKLLKQMLSIYGKVISAQVFHKNSRTFGFAALEDTDSVHRIVEALNGRSLPNGNTLYVSRAVKAILKNFKKPLKQRSKGNGVYVKYLDKSFDEQRLTQVFSPFGTITSAKVFGAHNNPIQRYYSGFGFVCFETPESAEKAVREMNNTIVMNRPLFVSMVQSFEVRNMYLFNQRQQTNGGIACRKSSPQDYRLFN